ncbi:MAG: hypothetical protein K2W94_01080 [Alphaproteobacteria bacterium]|nr:hypothetical protein [Alphaproteobacteria bacterium]
MNYSRNHVSSWLKLCFCCLAVIIFSTISFSSYAMDDPEYEEFMGRELSSSLWQDIAANKTSPDEFAEACFKVVLMQKRTDQHEAFLQKDISTEELRDTANELWAGFFNVYGSFLNDEEREKQQKLGMRKRVFKVLKSLNSTEDALEEMMINVIADSISFCPNKTLPEASPEEQLAYARDIADTINTRIWLDLKKPTSAPLSEEAMHDKKEKIKKMFIGREHYQELDEQEKTKLSEYRMWCTVKAFHSFTWYLYQLSGKTKFCNEEGGFDFEKAESLIYENLNSFLPEGMPEQDAKTMFQDMMAFPPAEKSKV